MINLTVSHHLRLIILGLLLALGAGFGTSLADVPNRPIHFQSPLPTPVATITPNSWPPATPIPPDEPNRAGMVVQFGDGSVVQACVEFTEPSITGWELLNRSGLTVFAEDYGASNFAVCRLDEGSNSDGCEYPLNDCWCQCVTPGNCNYWAYHHLTDGEWAYSNEGASGWTIENGMVDGWGWGLGEINNSGVAPPVIPFDQICFPDTPVPTPTTTPTTPTPWPTDTPIPPPTSTPPPPPPVEIPEPATLLLVGSGLAGLAAYARRRRAA